jgi:hypothetical protein
VRLHAHDSKVLKYALATIQRKLCSRNGNAMIESEVGSARAHDKFKDSTQMLFLKEDLDHLPVPRVALETTLLINYARY